MSRRTRIGIVIAVVLIGGFIAWMIYVNRGNMMDVKVASANGSNYSLELPPDMKHAQYNGNASFQYHSDALDISYLIIDDSKEKIASFGLDYDLDTYMKIATRTLDSAGLYVNSSITINDVKALQATIQGTRDTIANTYILTTVETERYYYQLVCWTPTAKFDVNKPAMEAMINSFREENPQPKEAE